MEASELVLRAAKRLGVEGDAALATALGLVGYNAPSRVRRWRVGENEPDYSATLLLLEAAGLLRQAPASSTTHQLADAEVIALLEELEAEIASVFARLLKRLSRQERRASNGPS